MTSISKNVYLFLGLSLVVFLACDRRSDEDKWEAEIRYFFYQHQEDYTSYVPVNFQKIDLAFLESQQPIQEALLVVQDTTKMRIEQMNLAHLSAEVEQLISFSQPFAIDEIDDFLKVRASADRQLSERSKTRSTAYEQALIKEESAINQLANILAKFNLSIYSIDFETDPVIYSHQYEMDGVERSAIFELDKESAEILAFKELGVA